MSVRFATGATAVRRHVWKGKVWTAMPYRVLEDTGDYLVLACWPGLKSLAPAVWIDSMHAPDPAARDRAIRQLASGSWELGWWEWRDTTVRSWYAIDDYFTVRQFFDAEQRPVGWYVDFDLPKQRTAHGIDTFDLLVDLVVSPDLAQREWKDEEEYEQGRRLGLIDDRVHARVAEARERVVGLIETRQGPFAHDWSAMRPESWQAPTLPGDVL